MIEISKQNPEKELEDDIELVNILSMLDIKIRIHEISKTITPSTEIARKFTTTEKELIIKDQQRNEDVKYLLDRLHGIFPELFYEITTSNYQYFSMSLQYKADIIWNKFMEKFEYEPNDKNRKKKQLKERRRFIKLVNQYYQNEGKFQTNTKMVLFVDLSNLCYFRIFNPSTS